MVVGGIQCLQPRIDAGEQSIGSNLNASEFVYFLKNKMLKFIFFIISWKLISQAAILHIIQS